MLQVSFSYFSCKHLAQAASLLVCVTVDERTHVAHRLHGVHLCSCLPGIAGVQLVSGDLLLQLKLLLSAKLL